MNRQILPDPHDQRTRITRARHRARKDDLKIGINQAQMGEGKPIQRDMMHGSGKNLGLWELDGYAGHAARRAHTSISQHGRPNRDDYGTECVATMVARSYAGEMWVVEHKHGVKMSRQAEIRLAR